MTKTSTIRVAGALLAASILVAPRAAAAQWASARVLAPPSAVVAAGATRLEGRAASRDGSLPIEILAGAAGSLAGIAIVGLNADCGTDDLGCIITAVAGGGALGAVGATVAVILAARATGAPRSWAGAGLGAVVGTVGGLGVHWLLNRGSDRNLGDRIVIPIFVLAQGTGAALGSRLPGAR